MSKKISALTLAALLAVSMTAFAGETGKTCNKKDTAACAKKESCKEKCKDGEKCDKENHDKCEKKETKAAA